MRRPLDSQTARRPQQEFFKIPFEDGVQIGMKRPLDGKTARQPSQEFFKIPFEDGVHIDMRQPDGQAASTRIFQNPLLRWCTQV